MTVKQPADENAIVEHHASIERAFMRNLIYRAAAVTLIVSLSAACREPHPFSNAESNESFDAPIREETVDLGASPYYPDREGSHPTALSCYYFSGFMVKEHDLGGRGAEWLSILRSPEEAPECKSSHASGERIIEYPEWEGYFMGVKGNLVFFGGSDTVNGGLPFAVYDSLNGNRIFEDSVFYEPASSSSPVAVVSTSGGYLIRYQRVAATDCDLNSEGAACWNRIKAEYAFPSDDMPLCTGYQQIADLAGSDRVESSIAYAVEVTLSPLPSVQGIPGSIRCWPSL